MGLNRRNPTQVDVLDFSDFVSVHGISALDAIFPKVNGDLDPPPNYLSTGAKMREWRSFTKANQQREIEQCAEEERRQAVTASRDRERLERRRNREQTSSNSAPLSHDTAHIDQLATESTTPVGDTVQQSNLDSSTSVQDPTTFATDDENASQAHDNVSVEDKVSKTCKITSAADIVDELDDNDDTNKSVTFNIPTPTTSASARALGSTMMRCIERYLMWRRQGQILMIRIFSSASIQIDLWM